MSGIAGKNALVKVATTEGGSYNTVLGIKSANFAMDGASIDVSEMGVAYVQRIQGLKDGKLSMSGSYRADDTTGQGECFDAWNDDSELWMKVLPDGSTGFKQQVVCTKFGIDASVEDKVAVSIELEGTGAISAV